MSEHLDPIEAEALKLDILSDLGADYEGDAYDLYKTVMYAGGDPLAFKEWLDSIQALAKGNDDHNLLICSEMKMSHIITRRK